MDVCDECKAVEICSCEDFCIAPDGGITAATDYVVTVTDKFGIKYVKTINTGGYATICIDTSDFPEGFFNPYAGMMIVEIQETDETPVQVVYGSISYTCIALSIKDCE